MYLPEGTNIQSSVEHGSLMWIRLEEPVIGKQHKYEDCAELQHFKRVIAV